jgi:hypothetical protein
LRAEGFVWVAGKVPVLGGLGCQQIVSGVVAGCVFAIGLLPKKIKNYLPFPWAGR